MLWLYFWGTLLLSIYILSIIRSHSCCCWAIIVLLFCSYASSLDPLWKWSWLSAGDVSQDVGFYVRIYVSASLFWQNIRSCPTWRAGLLQWVCFLPPIRPTYISYRLKPTNSGGEIAQWIQCPNKCLHVVQGQRSRATKPIHLARWSPHRACVKLR